MTVCCVWVAGPVPYSADYVRRLKRMVARYLQRPHRFVCLTDQPEALPDIETIRIDSMRGVVPDNGAGYWAKVRLFDPAIGFEGRVLFLDLDVLVISDLSPIVDFPAPFAITEDALVQERAHLDRDRYNRKLVRRFNSSVMVWYGGLYRDLWECWTPDVAQRLSTDQDWIGERYYHAAAMPLAWFPRISRVQPPWPDDAKVVLVKKPKPHDAVKRWPWFESMWGGWPA